MFFKCRLFAQLQSKRGDLFLLKNKTLFVHYFENYTWPLVEVSHTHHPPSLKKGHSEQKNFEKKSCTVNDECVVEILI